MTPNIFPVEILSEEDALSEIVNVLAVATLSSPLALSSSVLANVEIFDIESVADEVSSMFLPKIDTVEMLSSVLALSSIVFLTVTAVVTVSSEVAVSEIDDNVVSL